MSDLTKGEVIIVIDGDEYTLKPSLTAFTQLSANGADYSGIIGAIMRNDVNMMTKVIRLGLGYSDREARDIPAMIYKSGMLALQNPLTDFVFRLFNSGRSPEEVQQEAIEAQEKRPLAAG